MVDSNNNSNDQNQTPTWLSIGKASRMLGVNESTLRHWADQKAVRTFRTSGGHRRFAKEDLYLLMTRSSGPWETKSLADLKDLALTRIRRKLGRGRTAPSGWYGSLTESQKLKLRFLGRRLLASAGEYLTHQRGRSHLLEEAREIGEEYGFLASEFGMSLDDALEAFLFFRNSLDSVAMEITKERDLTAPQAVEVYRQLNTFTDQILMSNVRAYQEAATGSRVAGKRNLAAEHAEP